MSPLRLKRSWKLYLAICSSVILCATCGRFLAAEPGTKNDAPPADVIGTWQQVVVLVGNEVRPPRKGGTEVKLLHITPTHFTRIVYNPKTSQLLGVVGGTSPLAAGKHVETVAYADEASRKQAEGKAPLEFQSMLEGDMLTLALPGANPKYVETWKRVK